MADASSPPANAFSASKSSQKSFEFRMCKKVAELTQVVHMLFVKNHEKEVELEAVRAAYEQEISNVIADARRKLEKSSAEAQEKEDRPSLNLKREQNLEEKLREISQKFEEREIRVKDLERDNNFMREEIVRLQKFADDSKSAADPSDAEKLRNCQKQLDHSQAELKAKMVELEQVQEMMRKQSNQCKVKDSVVQQLRTEIEKMQSDLSLQISNLKSELVESSNNKERLQHKNKSLESELRNLKRELENVTRQSDVSLPSARLRKSPGHDTNDELERLRREVRMYRMELSNREGNFNRMFTDSSPVRLDHRAGGLAMVRTRTDMNIQPSRSQMIGNQSPRDVSTNNQQLQHRPGFNRFPTLSMDRQQRATNSRSARNGRLVGTAKEEETAGFSMPGFH